MPPETSPTARALRTLEILGTRPGATAAELAGRLGVTERAARRYVGILREAGLPVTAVRGPHGGYRLGRGTRLPPVSFTQTEALGLVMAVINGAPGATGDDLVDLALDKVIRALPADVGHQAGVLRRHASATPDRYAARPDTTITGDLVTAVAARRRVRVTYRTESGREHAAEVDPWAVVVRHGRWYLLCHSHRAGAVRTYRVDRVLAVRRLDQEFVPPDGLDPVAALEDHLGTGWRFTTRVVFDAPLPDVAPWVGAQMGRLEAAGDRCVLTGSTRNPAAYAQEQLARVPFAYRVEGGPELRDAVAALAGRLTAALADPAP